MVRKENIVGAFFEKLFDSQCSLEMVQSSLFELGVKTSSHVSCFQITNAHVPCSCSHI